MFKISDEMERAVDLLGVPQSCIFRTIVQEKNDERPYLQSNMVLKANDDVIRSWPERCNIRTVSGALQVDNCIVVITLNMFPDPHPLIFENYWNYWASPEYQKIFDDMTVQDSIKFILFGANSKEVIRVVETENPFKDFFKKTIDSISSQEKWSFEEFDDAKYKILRTYSLQELWDKMIDGSMDSYEGFYD